MLRYIVPSLLVSAALLFSAVAAELKSTSVPASPGQPANLKKPAIDMEGYLRVSLEASKHRDTRRLSEEDFIKMSGEKGTIVLDARSKEKFDLLHIKGAINLAFADIAVSSLKETIPDKNTRILIYCNNNFRNNERAFATKLPVASLNLSTYIALYSYGYRNIYELAPQVDPKLSKLTFASAPLKK